MKITSAYGMLCGALASLLLCLSCCPQVIIEPKQDSHLSIQASLSLLKSVVRIRNSFGGGSGVIINIEPAKRADGYYRTFIITAAHVTRGEKSVKIDCFSYKNNRTILSVKEFDGIVLADNRPLDAALIEIKTEKKEFDFRAQLIDEKDLESLTLCQQVSICGAGALQPVYFSGRGEIVGFNDAEGAVFTTGVAIPGSSGGGIFLANGKILGLVSKIGSVPFGPDAHAVPVFEFIVGVHGLSIRHWLEQLRMEWVLS